MYASSLVKKQQICFVLLFYYSVTYIPESVQI